MYMKLPERPILMSSMTLTPSMISDFGNRMRSRFRGLAP
jgi:hypothetical protein